MDVDPQWIFVELSLLTTINVSSLKIHHNDVNAYLNGMWKLGLIVFVNLREFLNPKHPSFVALSIFLPTECIKHLDKLPFACCSCLEQKLHFANNRAKPSQKSSLSSKLTQK